MDGSQSRIPEQLEMSTLVSLSVFEIILSDLPAKTLPTHSLRLSVCESVDRWSSAYDMRFTLQQSSSFYRLTQVARSIQPGPAGHVHSGHDTSCETRFSIAPNRLKLGKGIREEA